MGSASSWVEDDVRFLFERALNLPVDVRSAFFDEHCAHDSGLRHRVEGLLAAAAQPGLLPEDDDPLIGRTVGYFTVTQLLGRGGMGRVYRAVDNRLGRDVAVKVIDGTVNDGQLTARFRREARILASLNHPNIAVLHGVEEHDDHSWLILEFVKGRTLAARLDDGPLPVAEATAIARGVSQALEAAHEQGVIHRDLKPGNVMLDADGRVKVLDFGIAKTVRPDSAATEPSHSERLAATREGQVIGTLGYMSPESLRGLPADRRADIWAFGVVLFEMLAGRSPFDSADSTLTLARVLESEPQWRLLPTDVPPQLRWLLERCLVKDPSRRLQAIGEARLVLEGDLRVGGGGVRPTTAIPAWTHRVLLTVVGGLLGASLTFVARPDAPPDPVTQFTVTQADGPLVHSRGLALSSDGQLLAVAKEEGIYLRARDETEPSLMAGTAGASTPVFSHNDEWIAFQRPETGEIVRVPVAGGPSSPIGKIACAFGLDWAPGGAFVLAPGGSGLILVAEAGGDPVALTESGDGPKHRWPSVLPDGRAVVYTVGERASARLAIVDLETGETRDLGVNGTHARYVSPGFLVFGRDNALWAVPFDLNRREVTGGAQLVEPDVAIQPTGEVIVAVDRRGALAYQRASSSDAIVPVLIDADGVETILTDEVRAYREPRFSPDGKRIALEAEGDLWILDVARRSVSRLTTDGGNSRPVWSSGGDDVVFRKGDEGYSVPWNRSAEPTRIDTTADSNGDDPSVIAPQVSPDGKWQAYTSDEAGRHDVYVRAFPGAGPRYKVSTSGGGAHAWGPRGQSVFFVDADEEVRAVRFQPEAADPIGWSIRVLRVPSDRFRAPGLLARSYDAAPDGAFVVLRYAQPRAGRIAVAYHWADHLRDGAAR